MNRDFIRHALNREREIAGLKQVFPETWKTLVETMDALDRASFGKPSPYIKQMWAHGTCHAEEVMAVYGMCPAAFRNHKLGDVIGKRADEILPELAKSLP